MPYKVGKYPGVAEKMRMLGDLATLAGMRRRYLDALNMMMRRLQEDPLTWGDPQFHLHIEGGTVCSALVDLIVVRYAVHEPEKAVIIRDILPLFEWPIRP